MTTKIKISKRKRRVTPEQKIRRQHAERIHEPTGLTHREVEKILSAQFFWCAYLRSKFGARVVRIGRGDTTHDLIELKAADNLNRQLARKAGIELDEVSFGICRVHLVRAKTAAAHAAVHEWIDLKMAADVEAVEKHRKEKKQ